MLQESKIKKSDELISSQNEVIQRLRNDRSKMEAVLNESKIEAKRLNSELSSVNSFVIKVTDAITKFQSELARGYIPFFRSPPILNRGGRRAIVEREAI